MTKLQGASLFFFFKKKGEVRMVSLSLMEP